MKLYCPSCKSPVSDDNDQHCTVCFFGKPGDGWPREGDDAPSLADSSTSSTPSRRRTATVVEPSGVTSDINAIVAKHVKDSDPWGVALNKPAASPASENVTNTPPQTPAPPKPVEPPPPEQPPAQNTQTPFPDSVSEPPKKKEISKSLIIGGVVVAVLLFCCCPGSIGGYYYSGMFDSSAKKKPTKKKKKKKKKKPKKKSKKKKKSSSVLPQQDSAKADALAQCGRVGAWVVQIQADRWSLHDRSVGIGT